MQEKLKELQSLLDDNLITPEEYEKMRKNILSGEQSVNIDGFNQKTLRCQLKIKQIRL
ncbi:SHOCT domain-containing protein [Leuconostoc mesenteroides]|uniref:SHOCT domain-containing protein n=1 Tax=Leuconostoc mesenteroides TaxID=1245 RepID=UPI0009BD3C0B|nr:SHOCT domain-containing protein [Leuconostoc mesenteroides]